MKQFRALGGLAALALLALTGIVFAKEKAANGSLNGEFAARIVDELLLGLATR